MDKFPFFMPSINKLDSSDKKQIEIDTITDMRITQTQFDKTII